MQARDLFRLLRVRHWVKNAFVLLPVPFALHVGAEMQPLLFGVGVLAFCLLSSGVYVLNDIADRERDRAHPRKKERPIAAGRVEITAAALFCATLLAAGLGLLWVAGRAPAITVGSIYLGVNIGYSCGLKHVPVLDVFLLASGFVLRVVLGCALLAVSPSSWLLLCTSSLALLLAFGKRRADLVVGIDEAHRPSLRSYDQNFVELAMGLTAALTLLTYALYCKDSGVFRPGAEFYSVPFVAFGILDYLRRVLGPDAHKGPVELVFSGPSFWVTGGLWMGTVVLGLASSR